MFTARALAAALLTFTTLTTNVQSVDVSSCAVSCLAASSSRCKASRLPHGRLQYDGACVCTSRALNKLENCISTTCPSQIDALPALEEALCNGDGILQFQHNPIIIARQGTTGVPAPTPAPAPGTPAPAPGTPAPAPGTPAPAPGTPAPAPGTPAPGTPAPGTPPPASTRPPVSVPPSPTEPAPSEPAPESSTAPAESELPSGSEPAPAPSASGSAAVPSGSGGTTSRASGSGAAPTRTLSGSAGGEPADEGESTLSDALSTRPRTDGPAATGSVTGRSTTSIPETTQSLAFTTTIDRNEVPTGTVTEIFSASDVPFVSTVSAPASTGIASPPPPPPPGVVYQNESTSALSSRVAYDPVDAFKEVSNPPECAGGSTSYTSDPNSSIEFKFTGTAVYFNTIGSAKTGVYSVTVDDQEPIDVDGFYPNPKVLATCGVGFSAEGLRDGPHTIKVTYVGPSPNSIGSTREAGIEFSSFTYTEGVRADNAASVVRTSLGAVLPIMITLFFTFML